MKREDNRLVLKLTEPWKKANNHSLNKAKVLRDDEFFTKKEDIEKELRFYKKHFKDKVVYCNCDEPGKSSFYKYFFENFKYLKLKGLISSFYKKNGKGWWSKYDGVKVKVGQFFGNGDFRNKENMDLLEEADLVVTNPPFSLFRKYIAQLICFEKSFLIIGNLNGIVYKEVFGHVVANKIWTGFTSPREFVIPSGDVRKFGNITWFTNLDHKKRGLSLPLFKRYTEKEYPFYENYNAINVDKVLDIPMDYFGKMAVPITFLSSYNRRDFELVTTGRILQQGVVGAEESFYILKDAVVKKAGCLRSVYSRVVIQRVDEKIANECRLISEEMNPCLAKGAKQGRNDGYRIANYSLKKGEVGQGMLDVVLESAPDLYKVFRKRSQLSLDMPLYNVIESGGRFCIVEGSPFGWNYEDYIKFEGEFLVVKKKDGQVRYEIPLVGLG